MGRLRCAELLFLACALAACGPEAVEDAAPPDAAAAPHADGAGAADDVPPPPLGSASGAPDAPAEAPPEVTAPTLTDATGTVRIDGAARKLPVVLVKGMRFETAAGTATVRLPGGDVVTLGPDSSATYEGEDEGRAYVFVRTGSARGALGTKTVLGVSVGWAQVAEGMRTDVAVAAAPGRAAVEGTFRTERSGAWIRLGGDAVWLDAGCEVAISRPRGNRNVLGVRAATASTGQVDVHRTTAGGKVVAILLRGMSATLEDAAEGRVRVGNTSEAATAARVLVTATFGEKTNADLGPGESKEFGAR